MIFEVNVVDMLGELLELGVMFAYANKNTSY
jgi:hypothetical protein